MRERPPTPPIGRVQAFFLRPGGLLYLSRLSDPAIPLHLSRPSRLNVLARGLPFAVDDFEAAGDAFVRWCEHRSMKDLRTVELWTYCYTIWYFHAKFARERTSGVSDLDAALDRSYDRVMTSLQTVREPKLFPHFVSVVCKNVLRNHRTRRREIIEMHENMSLIVETGAHAYDQVLVRQALSRAIAAMPAAIRDIGRMRLLEERSYQEIADVTERPIASVRTYVSKVKRRLRDNPDVRALYEDPPQLGDDSVSDQSMGDGAGCPLERLALSALPMP